MKKIPTLIILICLTFSAFSQNSEERIKVNKEKLKTLKIAHITERLSLTKKEAQAFWPIYNKNEEKRDEIKESQKGQLESEDINALSDTDAEKRLKNIVILEEKREQQEKDYHKQLTKVLSAKKILLLRHADRSFRRKVLEEYRGRHKRQKEK